jgi:His/Glu/Gln/Arg/opine family amino acid ABC transporter permease subunit
VNYVFQFNIVWDHLPELLEGALLTIRLSATAMALGLCLALLCACGQSAGPRPVRWLVASYVELIRNTPFLVQIFIFYFSLPMIGIRLTADAAALAAMTVNLGAYASEIVRAGIEAIPRGQIEAARARFEAPADLSLHHHLPGIEDRVSGARQPVHPVDAELERGLDDLGRRAHGDHQLADINHLPLIRVLLRRDRPLPRYGARFQGGLERHLLDHLPARPRGVS